MAGDAAATSASVSFGRAEAAVGWRLLGHAVESVAAKKVALSSRDAEAPRATAAAAAAAAYAHVAAARRAAW